MMIIDHKEVIDLIGELELHALKKIDGEYAKGVLSAFSQTLIEGLEEYAEKEMNNIAKQNAKKDFTGCPTCGQKVDIG